MIKINENIISIETTNTSLILAVLDYDDPRTPFNHNKKYVRQLYYGLTNKKPAEFIYDNKKNRCFRNGLKTSQICLTGYRLLQVHL